jgi:hypothetical protein
MNLAYIFQGLGIGCDDGRDVRGKEKEQASL